MTTHRLVYSSEFELFVKPLPESSTKIASALFCSRIITLEFLQTFGGHGETLWLFFDLILILISHTSSPVETDR